MLIVAWLIVGAALWNAIFDLYLARGAREYLQARAEFELGLAPEPEVGRAMGQARRHGVIAASAWAAVVTGLGLATIRASRVGSLRLSKESSPR